MINTQTLARPYAKAAFEFAREAKRIESWSAMLSLSAVAVEVPQVAELLKNPRLSDEGKVTILVEAFGDQVDEAFRNFVNTLGEHHRLPLLPTIQTLFEDLKAAADNTLDVEVQTAYELSTEQLQTLAAALSKRLDRTVNPKQVLNPALIGGVLVRAGDVVVDGSIRGKLSQLAESLKS